MKWAYLGSDYKRGWPCRPRRVEMPRGRSMCSQRCSHSMLRSSRSMLRLPLTASQWLVALLGLASSAGGSVCGVGEAWEGVGARESSSRALVSWTSGTRDPAILTGCSVFLVLHVVSGIVRCWRFTTDHRDPNGSQVEAEKFGPGQARAPTTSDTYVDQVEQL